MENRLYNFYDKLNITTKENILMITLGFNLIENRNISFIKRVKLIDSRNISSYKEQINCNFEMYCNHYNLNYFTKEYLIDNFDNDNNSKKFLDFVFDDDEYINSDSDISKKFKIICYLVYRVRNNLFHGIKDISDLNRYNPLFELCNYSLNILLKMMNINM